MKSNFQSDIFNVIMIVICFLCFCALMAPAAETANVTNTVMMVDQNGKMNVSGVASVADVATNAANVQIAIAKAEAAEETAEKYKDATDTLVEAQMQNNAVIYRRGFTDSFEGLVTFGADDKLAIVAFEKRGITGGILSAYLEYVCTADVKTVKPTVRISDTCTAREDFLVADDATVSTPVYHEGERTYPFTDDDGNVSTITFAGYYSVELNTPVEGEEDDYFYYVQLSGDTPSGDGSTLDIGNGVTGGVSAEVVWGDKKLTFVGGVLVGVSDV